MKMRNRNTHSQTSRIEPRLICRQCMSGGLESFVRGVEAGRDRHAGAAFVAHVREQLKILVADSRWICAPHRLPDPARTGPTQYTVHKLYVAADGAWSAVACVWRPGQVTPLHDHLGWGAVGVLEGRESETTFERMKDCAGEFLHESGRGHFVPGDVISFAPPESNIHRVRNTGESTAISLHVYGLDITATGSSINEIFDDAMIRPAQGPAVALPWRPREAGR